MSIGRTPIELTLAGVPHSYSTPDEGAGVVEPEYRKDLSVERPAEDVGRE